MTIMAGIETLAANALSVDYIHRFISSLVFTIIIETLVLFLLIRFLFKNKKLETRKIIFAGVIASFATIPYVWFVFPYMAAWPRSTSLYFSEPFVFVIEAVLYHHLLKANWQSSLLLSFLCNLASYLLGPWLRAHGMWVYW